MDATAACQIILPCLDKRHDGGPHWPGESRPGFEDALQVSV
jgi:hypothetical protein